MTVEVRTAIVGLPWLIWLSGLPIEAATISEAIVAGPVGLPRLGWCARLSVEASAVPEAVVAGLVGLAWTVEVGAAVTAGLAIEVRAVVSDKA